MIRLLPNTAYVRAPQTTDTTCEDDRQAESQTYVHSPRTAARPSTLNAELILYPALQLNEAIDRGLVADHLISTDT
jgi:hypothetical protein